MHRSPILVSLLASALLLASCGDATEPAPAAVDRPAASEPAEPSSTAAGESPAGSSEAEKGDDEKKADAEAPAEKKTDAGAPAGKTDADPPAGGRNAGATDDDGPTHDAPGSGGSDGGTEGLPGWPIESTPVHGGTFWAAYVAVGAPGDPALQQVLAEVQQRWPGAGLGELACDEGAAAALGRSSTEHAVAVYFDTEQHITEFRRRWEAPFVGAVRVTTVCAD